MPAKKKEKRKWAIILGASSGFGMASALELADAGFNICGVHFDRRSAMPAINRMRAKIRKKGVEEQFFNMNAADPDNMAIVIKDVRKAAKGVRNPVAVLIHSLAFGSLHKFVGEKRGEGIKQKQIDLTHNVMANSLLYWVQELTYTKSLKFSHLLVEYFHTVGFCLQN